MLNQVGKGKRVHENKSFIYVSLCEYSAYVHLYFVCLHIVYLVRLSSGHGESSESDRDSSVASGEMRKEEEGGGRKQRASSGRERCSSQE